MKRLIALFAFLSTMLASTGCYAEAGNIHGTYAYDGENIDGVTVELYKIADYDGEGFNFEPPYLGHEVDIGSMTNSELGEYGQELAEVEAEPASSQQTTDGSYYFGDMDEGIWLVTFKDITIGDYTYSALPIVLTMPDLNRSYQLELTVKIEKSCPDCEPEPEPEPVPPEEDNSNTRDKIWFYIRLLIALIVIETLTLFVIIKDKEKKGQNEEK